MPFTTVADADIWWESLGIGAPVVLINGLGSPSDTWFRLGALLQADYRVITIDNRGTGRTVAPSAPHAVSTMAADVVAVIGAAGLASAHVVGHSMGGFIAQELALDHPHVVRSLVLASSHVGIPHLAVDLDPTTGPSTARALTAAGSLPPADRAAALRGLLYSAKTSVDLIAEDEEVRAAQPTTAEGYRNQLLGASVWERLLDLATLPMPTLVLHGADDQIVPPRSGERLAAAISGAQFELFADAGHALFTDATHPVASAIKGFFSRQTVRA